MEPYERPLVVYDKTSRDPTLMKRRDFIKTSMVISAFGTRLPYGSRAQTTAIRAYSQWESDRIVILIKLNGGNDGLNTVSRSRVNLLSSSTHTCNSFGSNIISE
ncbi:MAG: hypothetical protein Ct9H300mP9_3960 [Candidatus Neomarinimicrobiota bacterium]|nr:MAG: hypothetical protein Ct9H300mP9_3960 [Candidatus Neomarinimicrobiota bacterium]